MVIAKDRKKKIKNKTKTNKSRSKNSPQDKGSFSSKFQVQALNKPQFRQIYKNKSQTISLYLTQLLKLKKVFSPHTGAWIDKTRRQSVKHRQQQGWNSLTLFGMIFPNPPSSPLPSLPPSLLPLSNTNTRGFTTSQHVFSATTGHKGVCSYQLSAAVLRGTTDAVHTESRSRIFTSKQHIQIVNNKVLQNNWNVCKVLWT